MIQPRLHKTYTDRKGRSDLTPDGTRALSVLTEDKAWFRMHIWEPATGKNLFRHPEQLDPKMLSLDDRHGRYVGWTRDRYYLPPGGAPPGDLSIIYEAFLWDAEQDHSVMLPQAEFDRVHRLGWWNEHLVTVANRTADVWTAQGERVGQVPIVNGYATGFGSAENCALFFKDTITLVMPHVWQVYDTITLPTRDIKGLTWSPDSKYWAMHSDEEEQCLLIIWDVAARAEHRVIRGTKLICGAEWSPDSTLIAVGDRVRESDRRSHKFSGQDVVRIWDIAHDRQAALLENLTGRLVSLEWGGEWLLVSTDQEVQVWHIG